LTTYSQMLFWLEHILSFYRFSKSLWCWFANFQFCLKLNSRWWWWCCTPNDIKPRYWVAFSVFPFELRWRRSEREDNFVHCLTMSNLLENISTSLNYVKEKNCKQKFLNWEWTIKEVGILKVGPCLDNRPW